MKDRRNFLIKSVGLGVGALAASKIASQLSSTLISSASAAEKPAANPSYAKLSQVASDCVRTGLACISHCQKEMAAGSKAMAKCNTSTHEMVAISEAMLQLSS